MSSIVHYALLVTLLLIVAAFGYINGGIEEMLRSILLGLVGYIAGRAMREYW